LREAAISYATGVFIDQIATKEITQDIMNRYQKLKEDIKKLKASNGKCDDHDDFMPVEQIEAAFNEPTQEL
jgi:hypothetical protein